MIYNGCNIEDVEVYGQFNADPLIKTIMRIAHVNYGYAVDWKATFNNIRYNLTLAVSDYTRISESSVLIDVITSSTAATYVLMPYSDAVDVMHRTVNAETVEPMIEFLPMWGFVEYGSVAQDAA